MVRSFQETDLDQVLKIWLDTNQQAHGFIPASYWKEHLAAVQELLPQAEVYVWEGAEKEIQGFVGLQGDQIEGIFVQNSSQSAGIGKKLIDYIKNTKNQLSLHVYQRNTRAVGFYQREHFCIQYENVDGQTGEKEYVMVWNRQR